MLRFAAALLALGSASAAYAQETAAGPAPAEDEAAAEIVVTAQRRTQNVQDVPIAITVVSGDVLARQGALNLEGAQYLVPSLNFRKSGTAINQSLFLRGVGTATFSIAGEPSISTVLDGVVLSRAGEAFTDLVDIERIEVLRGPQGTLFGKNASAGVINIVTKRPTAEFGGFVEASYFSDSEVRLRGVVNVPLGENIRTRITAFGGRWDGNILNEAVRRQVNGYARWGVRGVVEADVTPDLVATFIADYRQANDNCCAEVLGTTPNNIFAAALPRARGDETRRNAQNLITRTEEESWGVSLQLDQSLGEHTLTSISAYRRYDNREIRDGDFLPTAFANAGGFQSHDDGPQTGDTFTQEIRLTSPADRTLTYVIGGFFYYADTTRTFQRDAFSCGFAPGVPTTALTPCGSPGTVPGLTARGVARFGSTFYNYAVYADGTLQAAPGFRLLGGIRYTRDELDVFHSRATSGLPLNAAGVPQTFGGIQANFDQGVFNSAAALPPNGTPLASNGVPFTSSTSANNLSGRFGMQVDVTPDIMGYVTYARGYKGPAFNVFFNLNANGTNALEPEESDAVEIGLKNTLFGGKLLLNLVGYFASYYNFQANNPDIVAGFVITRFTNAGRVSTRGFELDAIYRAGRDFNVNGGLAYTDAQVDAFRAPTAGAVVGQAIPSGTELAYAPTWRASLGFDWRIRTGNAVDFALGGQGSYQSSQLSQFDANAAVRAATTIRAYSLVDLTASILSADDRWRVQFQVRNLFDESFAAAIGSGGPGGSFRYIIPREADRFFGVTARLNY